MHQDLDGWIAKAKAERVTDDERLRDAAPELLAALREWHSLYDGWSATQLLRRADPATLRRIQATRAAIAKAEGR